MEFKPEGPKRRKKVAAYSPEITVLVFFLHIAASMFIRKEWLILGGHVKPNGKKPVSLLRMLAELNNNRW